MELIPNNLNIDFVGKRRYFIFGSLIVNLAILVGIAIWQFNWGVDFAGGSELEVKFEKQVSPAKVRQTIEAAGFEDASVQEIGRPEENSFLIRVGRVSLMTPEDATKAEAALKQKFGAELSSFDFNPDFGDKIELRFKNKVSGDGIKQAIEGIGIKVQEVREVPNGYTVITAGISEKVRAALDAAKGEEGMAAAELRRVEFVGPQVGKQLRNKGILSIIYASLAILAYIAFRFDTRFAPGAIVAMVHDIIVVFGYYLVTRREFSLTSVAVILTIIGYSVNDTIVVYDRIRENAVKLKGMSLAHMVNVSLNETLSRTILTGMSTMLAMVGLLIFGVGQLWDFAAAIILGVLVGTYSSIYIASPTTIWLEGLGAKRAGSATAPAAKAG